MVARCGYMVNTWTVTAVAALALMAVVLATALPAWAQNGNGFERDYPENGAEPVATFTAVDPEGRTVYWDLLASDDTETIAGIAQAIDSADADDFSISMDGVLSFKSPPSFESPMGGTTTNTYKVVVVSSDDAPGAMTAGEAMSPKSAYHKVIVMVTDVDEDGSISLSAQQPQVGVALMATLTDQDSRRNADNSAIATNPIASASWKWEQSPAMDGPWTSDTRRRCHCRDRYRHHQRYQGESFPTLRLWKPLECTCGPWSPTPTSTVTTRPPWRSRPSRPGRKPVGGNSAPVFSAGTTDTRRVKENSPPGTAVGKPVKAGDAGDILTYTLGGTDMANYTINHATGQIMVGPRTDLDREDAGNTDFEHEVTVRATDPYGNPYGDAVESNSDSDGAEAAEIAITITIDNVNEPPKITTGPTRDRKAEDFDSDGDTANDTRELVVATYVATDVDVADTDTTVKWSLTGADAEDFEIDRNTVTEVIDAELSFKTAPNYEKPTDTDTDNMYMVTVVATDAKKLTATRDVVITVIDADEDGTITFSSVQPKVGIPFMATLTDPDGVVMESVKWQWYDGDPNVTAPDEGEIDDDATPIAKAKSDTYTPKPADADPNGDGEQTSDEGIMLHVWATYTDSTGSDKTATEAADYKVVVNRENRTPEFREGGDKPVMQATRSVAENTMAGSTDDDTAADGDTADNIGIPVNATDMSVPTDTLTYTLAGRDAAMFRVRQDNPTTENANEGGQIEVGAGTMLDHEKKKSYMVMVTATDPSLASATIGRDHQRHG